MALVGLIKVRLPSPHGAHLEAIVLSTDGADIRLTQDGTSLGDNFLLSTPCVLDSSWQDEPAKTSFHHE